LNGRNEIWYWVDGGENGVVLIDWEMGYDA
jgi:hypothetical protein